MTSLEFRTRLSEALRLSDAAYGSAVLSPLKMRGPSAYTYTTGTHAADGGQATVGPDLSVPLTVGASDVQVDLAVGSSIATLGQIHKSIDHLNSRVGHVENILANRITPLTALASQRPYAKGDWFDAVGPPPTKSNGYFYPANSQHHRTSEEVAWIKNLIHDALDPIRDTLRHHERLLMDVVSTVNAAVGWGQVGRLTMVAGHAQRLGEAIGHELPRYQKPAHRDAALPTGGVGSRRSSPQREAAPDEMLRKVDRLRRLASDIKSDMLFTEGQGVVSSSSGGSNNKPPGNYATPQPRNVHGSGESITTPSSNLTTTPSGGTTTTTKTSTTTTTTTPSEADKALAFRKLLDVNTTTSSSAASYAVGAGDRDQHNNTNNSGLNASTLEAVRGIVSAGAEPSVATGAASGVLVAPSALTRQHSDSQTQILSQDISAIENNGNSSTNVARRAVDGYSSQGDGLTPQGLRSVHFAADQTTFLISNNSTGNNNDTLATTAVSDNPSGYSRAVTVPSTTTANNTMHMTSMVTINPSGANYTMLNSTDEFGRNGDYSEIVTTARSLVGGLGAAFAGAGSRQQSSDPAEHSGAYRQFLGQTRQPSSSNQ